LVLNIQYLILILAIFVSFFISTIFIIISFFLILKENNIEKNTSYECGFQPFSDSRLPFNVHFYLVGLLFLIFDLEVLYIIPWSVSIFFLNFFSYSILIIFLFILTLGFFYEWKKGALNW